MSKLSNPRKYFSVALGVAVAAIAPGFAYGEIYSDGDSKVDATLSLHEDYDSNIFLNSSDIEDYVTTANATVKITRDAAIVASQLSAGANANYYKDNNDLNSIDPFVQGSVNYSPSDKTIATGNADYRRSSLANEVLNDRTKSDEFNLGGSFQNLFSEKLGFRVQGNYRDSDYLTTGYSDVFSYSLGGDVVYVYSPKLKALFGYNHRESWTENRPAGSANPASKDDRVAVGFEGDLAPKITGTVTVGWVDRKFETNRFSGGSTLFVHTGIRWVPAQKTSVVANANQDFDTTAANQSVKNSGLSVTVTQILDKKWSVDGTIAYNHAVYQAADPRDSRRDNNFRIKARATYALATNVGLEMVLGYGDVDSVNPVTNAQIPFSTYNRLNAGLGITASF